MGNVGNELPLIIVSLGDFFRHVIQRLCKVTHLIPARYHDAIIIFSGCIVHRSARDLLQRAINKDIKNPKNREGKEENKEQSYKKDLHRFRLLLFDFRKRKEEIKIRYGPKRTLYRRSGKQSFFFKKALKISVALNEGMLFARRFSAP